MLNFLRSLIGILVRTQHDLSKTYPQIIIIIIIIKSLTLCLDSLESKGFNF